MINLLTRCVPGKYSSRMKIAGRLGTPISKDIGYKIIFKSQIPLIFVDLLLNSDHHYALMLFYLMSEDQNLLQKKNSIREITNLYRKRKKSQR